MSTYNAVRERIAVPAVSDLVDSIAKSASTAFDNFERNAANSKRAEQTPQVAEAPLAQHWMQTMPTPTSRLGKSGTFALVVLVHALVFAVLGYLTPKFKDERATPLQVVSIEAPQSDTHTPPPPPPVPVPVLVQHFPDVNLPIEPVIDIYVDDSTSITVTPRPAEPAATTSVGTPKIVSSVEYVREPVAKYPPAARTLKQRGTVTLRALIDASGHASEVNVHRSSGYRLLDDTARTAVLNALFKPYMENGQFIPVYVFIPIEFGTAG